MACQYAERELLEIDVSFAPNQQNSAKVLVLH